MSDDFKVGDVVVRVLRGQETCSWEHEDDTGDTSSVQAGTLYRVSAVLPETSRDCAGLQLVGNWVPFGHCAGCFRKLPPASDEFTRMVRACKPQNKRVPA